MSSTLTHITMDSINGERVFLVRQYNSQWDVGKNPPIDTWESFGIVVEEDVLSYLISTRDDEAIWEKIKAESEPLPEKKRNNHVHPVFRDTINKL